MSKLGNKFSWIFREPDSLTTSTIILTPCADYVNTKEKKFLLQIFFIFSLFILLIDTVRHSRFFVQSWRIQRNYWEVSFIVLFNQNSLSRISQKYFDS